MKEQSAHQRLLWSRKWWEIDLLRICATWLEECHDVFSIEEASGEFMYTHTRFGGVQVTAGEIHLDRSY